MGVGPGQAGGGPMAAPATSRLGDQDGAHPVLHGAAQGGVQGPADFDAGSAVSRYPTGERALLPPRAAGAGGTERGPRGDRGGGRISAAWYPGPLPGGGASGGSG